MTDTGKKGKSKAATAEVGFTDEEREAMRERAEELKSARCGKGGKADGEADVLAKIAEMPDGDRQMAERIHALVKRSAPQLAAKTWYGMPAYTLEGKVVCFFQAASKFKARYATLGFSDEARLDQGTMWPSAFVLTEISEANEARIAALIREAVDADPA